MKIKTISRLEEDYTRDCKGDRVKIHRNLDPALHPFEKAREYTRALTAAKLEKMFAKPFVGALDGHTDGVFCTTTSPRSLVQFLSGACDGEIRVWDMSRRGCAWRAAGAHSGFVRGLAVTPDGESFLSCGDDGTVKRWELRVAAAGEPPPEPLRTWRSRRGGALRSLDHHRSEPRFATAGDAVELWDHHRADPISTFQWGADAIACIRFNPAERSLLAGAGGADRSICLYDTRAGTAMRKVVLKMRTNALAWNPREPMNFVAANEDHNVYQFDMRKLAQALLIHKGHVGPVMDVAFSPTGQEFASGGYDKTIRIFGHRDGTSREVYHTKRMQRVFCINFSADGRFVLSGSDDTNLRIWKARASERLAPVVPRERRKADYRESLKQRYRHLPEVRRILRHRHLPRGVRKAMDAEQLQRDKAKRKADNVQKHSAPGSLSFEPDRKRRIIGELV